MMMMMMMMTMMMSAATTVQTRFDASTLHDCPQVAMETGMVDDGSGNKKVNNFGLILNYQDLMRSDRTLSKRIVVLTVYERSMAASMQQFCLH